MKFYFTFGSWEKFPFQNTYLVVVAAGRKEAHAAFREKHPDVNTGVLNCSEVYSEEQWNRDCAKHYKEPAEVIWAKGCFGNAPEGFDDVFIFVPAAKQIVRISEGTGDNLLDEDREQGYVDYIYYEQYDLDAEMPEVDGGQILLDQFVQDKYERLADCIPDVLDMAYDNMLEHCMILSAPKES